MTAVVQVGNAPTLPERLRDAAWIAFVALIFGIPMIGLTTIDAGGKLVVQTRWALLGYFIVGPWKDFFPYLLVVAASSFVYVAVADLLPQLQRRLAWRETLSQLVWLAVALAVVVLARGLLHDH